MGRLYKTDARLPAEKRILNVRDVLVSIETLTGTLSTVTTVPGNSYSAAANADGIYLVGNNGYVKRVGYDGSVVNLVGNGVNGDEDGVGTAGRLGQTFSAALDGSVLWLADVAYGKIRKLDLDTNTLTTWLALPKVFGVGVGPAGTLFAQCAGAPGQLWQIDIATKTKTALSTPANAGAGVPVYVPRRSAVYVTSNDMSGSGGMAHGLWRHDLLGRSSAMLAGAGPAFADGAGSAARFLAPVGLTVGNLAKYAYIAEFSGARVRRVDLDTVTVGTLSGNGADGNADGTPGQTDHPTGISWYNNALWVAQATAGVRKIT